MPPSSGNAADNSADMRAVGMRKKIAEHSKKKIKGLPKMAVAGAFFRLPTVEMMRMRRERNEIFFTICCLLPRKAVHYTAFISIKTNEYVNLSQ